MVPLRIESLQSWEIFWYDLTYTYPNLLHDGMSVYHFDIIFRKENRVNVTMKYNRQETRASLNAEVPSAA